MRVPLRDAEAAVLIAQSRAIKAKRVGRNENHARELLCSLDWENDAITINPADVAHTQNESGMIRVEAPEGHRDLKHSIACRSASTSVPESSSHD